MSDVDVAKVGDRWRIERLKAGDSIAQQYTLPTQSGHGTEVLTTDGNTASWQPGGGSASTSILEQVFTCGENISGGMPVAIIAGFLFKFNVSNPLHYGLAVGISKQAGIAGNPIIVTLAGLNNQVGGLTPGLQYASGIGLISTIAPITGICLTLGVALDATNLVVSLSKPYIKL